MKPSILYTIGYGMRGAPPCSRTDLLRECLEEGSFIPGVLTPRKNATPVNVIHFLIPLSRAAICQKAATMFRWKVAVRNGSLRWTSSW